MTSADDPKQTARASKLSLSDPERRLVELMQRLHFGRIEGLQVRCGQLVFNPPPRVVKRLKLGGDSGPRPEIAHQDFLLRRQVVELLEAVASVGDGEVLAIDVRHGLPFSVEIEHCLQGSSHA